MINLSKQIKSSISTDTKFYFKRILIILKFCPFIHFRTGQRLAAGPTAKGQKEIRSPWVRYCTGVQYVIYHLLSLPCLVCVQYAFSALDLSKSIIFKRCDIAICFVTFRLFVSFCHSDRAPVAPWVTDRRENCHLTRSKCWGRLHIIDSSSQNLSVNGTFIFITQKLNKSGRRTLLRNTTASPSPLRTRALCCLGCTS